MGVFKRSNKDLGNRVGTSIIKKLVKKVYKKENRLGKKKCEKER